MTRQDVLDAGNKALPDKDLKYVDGEKNYLWAPSTTLHPSPQVTWAYQFIVQMVTSPDVRQVVVGSGPSAELSSEYRLPKVNEVSKYACDLAAALYKEVKERGWLSPCLEIPRDDVSSKFGFTGVEHGRN